MNTVVVLVNYNNRADTAACIRSLAATPRPPPLVVVDNGSRETGLEAALDGYPDGRILYAGENLGFGRGNNLGIRWALARTGCEYVFILNNDAGVEADTLERLERALAAHPGAGLAAPRIVMAEAPERLWYGGGEVDWLKGSARVPGHLGPADAPRALTAREVTFASGCAMLVRRAVFRTVGGFDPRYFMYEEDLELCLRVRAAGWALRYVPEALVRHRGQGSQRRPGEAFLPIRHPHNPRLAFYLHQIVRNRLLTMDRHARGRRAVAFWLAFPPYWALHCLRYLLHRRWDAVAAVGRGVRDYLDARRRPFVDELSAGTD